MAKPAVFLDRDGTINEEMGYLNHESRFVLISGVIEAIKRLNQAQWPVVVISNQAGLARGYFSAELLDKIHQKLKTSLAEKGAFLDALYFCPHHKDGIVKDLKIDCNCRKPKPGLFQKAAEDLNLNLSKSFMVGDKLSDIQAAHNIGAKGILVLSGYGQGEYCYELAKSNLKPDNISKDLNQAVDYILGLKA